MQSSSDTRVITVSSVIRKVGVWGTSCFTAWVRSFFLRGKRLSLPVEEKSVVL